MDLPIQDLRRYCTCHGKGGFLLFQKGKESLEYLFIDADLMHGLVYTIQQHAEQGEPLVEVRGLCPFDDVLCHLSCEDFVYLQKYLYYFSLN